MGFWSGRTSHDNVWLNTQAESVLGMEIAILNQPVLVEAMRVGVLSSPVGIHVDRMSRRVKRPGRKKVRRDRSRARREFKDSSQQSPQDLGQMRSLSLGSDQCL